MSRALRALSSTYVERRAKLAAGAALDGRGKRAAFALFYGPLHFLLVDHIVRTLPGARGAERVLDLGCGTGASGAAWASACERPAAVTAVDRNTWAVGEAADTYRHFGLVARVRRGDIERAPLPREAVSVLAAFTLNELSDQSREPLLQNLIEQAVRAGHQILIVEPVAGFVARWWGRARERVEAAGGRADEWRIRPALPPLVAKLDRAAGLDHREITGRSLFLSPATGAAARAASS